MTEQRIKQEIEALKAELSDTEELLSEQSINECHIEKDLLFDNIRKYRNYITAFEQIINGFPFEAGSY